MVAKIAFFPVDNGDMTLLTLESGRNVLIDVNIRAAADDPDDNTPDVVAELRRRLNRDEEGRLYVDAFLLSHPDQDHCAGLRKHFHLGPPNEWSEDSDKIFIREMWSSPRVFRSASRTNKLCDDAAAFSTEARRRVWRFREDGFATSGDRILILGEDENGKTDDLGQILVRAREVFYTVDGQADGSLQARLLAPIPADDEDDEEVQSNNHSSTILNFTLAAKGRTDAAKFLTGGDAEVAIWERLWGMHASMPQIFEYDILQAPHHCSWRSLSYDSWSEKGEGAEVCEDARNALAQVRSGALVVASSKEIKDDDSDPPCVRAKREYEEIADRFICVGELEDNPGLLEFEIDAYGPRRKHKRLDSAAVIGGGAVGGDPLSHG